ncbi:MAG: hypothetical protein Q8P30_00180 [Candidatus Uhrbacteria bacterium]|nr:hypothetical protein [Candidatus Uhrbacteria bacterium]
MSYLLLTGIVMFVVPLLVMIGFASFIFLSFIRDDDDASALLRIAFFIMIFGVVLIVAHYLIQSIGT